MSCRIPVRVVSFNTTTRRMFLSTHTALLPLILFMFVQHGAVGLQDVTGDLFGSENVGTVAAFGDFNSDKQTDVFVIREGE